LKQVGSINNSDVNNFRLQIDGVTVATVASLDSNGYVTFTFDKVLTTGGRTIKVLADIVGGSSKTVQMSFEDPSDADFKDVDYGVNVMATTGTAAGAISVNSGNITITTNNSALATTVSKNGSNILVGSFKFRAAGEAIKVKKLAVKLTGDVNNTADGIEGLKNGKIMINGAQAGSTADLLTAGTTYSINYTFQPGVDTTVEVYADMNNGSTSASLPSSLSVTIPTGGDNASNGDPAISSGYISIPKTEVAGGIISLGTASSTVAVTRTSNYANQTITLPQQSAYKVGSWTLTNGNTEDVNIDTLTFTVDRVDANFDASDMYDAYATYQIGSGSAVTTSTVSTVTADTTSHIGTISLSVSFTLPKSGTATVNLYSKLLKKNSSLSGGVSAITPTLAVAGTGADSSSTVGKSAVGQKITYNASSLTATKDASSPTATLVAANTTVTTAAYKFEAKNDSYTITKLVFNIPYTGATSVTGVNLKNGSTTLLANQSVVATASGTITTSVLTVGQTAIATINGSASTYTAPTGGSTNAQAATGLAAAINENSSVNSIVTATAVGNVVLIKSTGTEYALVAGGTGTTASGATLSKYDTVTFDGLNFAVASGTSQILSVEAILGDVGTFSGATHGDLTTTLDEYASTARTNSNGDNTSIVGTSLATVGGNTIIIYKAFPTVTLTSLGTSTLSVGTQTVANFTIKGTDNVAWNSLRININKSALVGLTGLKLLDSTGTLVSNATVAAMKDVSTAANGDGTDATFILITFAGNEEQVSSAGKTYRVQATLGAPTPWTGYQYISTQINKATGISSMASTTSSDVVAVAGTAANFVWSDMSAQSHAAGATTGTGTSDWNNEYLVTTPTDSQTLSVSL